LWCGSSTSGRRVPVVSGFSRTVDQPACAPFSILPDLPYLPYLTATHPTYPTRGT